MPSFQMHIASIAGCDPDELVDRLKQFIEGQGDSAREFVVLKYHRRKGSHAVRIDLARRIQCELQTIAAGPGGKLSLTATPAARAVASTVLINTKAERIETYGPGSQSLDHAADGFLINELGLPVLWERMKVDLSAAIDKLAAEVERLRIVNTGVGDYSHNSYMIGPYTPKFLDSQHGIDFLQEYIEGVKTVRVKFAGPAGPVGLSVKPVSSFSGSIRDEDDLAYVQSICRKLSGWKEAGSSG